MGYDIDGIKPKNKSGEYFRANIWGMQYIREIMFAADPEEKIFNAKDWKAISDNSGNTIPRTHCEKMAKAIIKSFAITPDDIIVSVANKIEGKILFRDDTPGFDIQKSIKDWQREYPTSTEETVRQVFQKRINELVSFLQNCGGLRCC